MKLFCFLSLCVCISSIYGASIPRRKFGLDTSCPGRRNIQFPPIGIRPRPIGIKPRGLGIGRTLTRSKRSAEEKDKASDIVERMALARQVDLCFLVDVTGSMSPYINGVRDSIFDIVKSLLNGTEGEVRDVRLAFVGYRDFSDDKTQNHFVISDFSKNVKQFRDTLSNTKAQGGAGIPEDVFGGLDKAMEDLNWGDIDRTRLIFHIADAPAHGCDMHLLPSDDYPNGDPEGRTMEELFGNMDEMKIQYYFGNITDKTDVMIQKFSEAYGSAISTFDIGVGNLRGAAASGRAAGFISKSVRKAVFSSVARKLGSLEK